MFSQMADVESSPGKEEEEEEDDTMQNTVVLFSNTDKFVLMQVRFVGECSIAVVYRLHVGPMFFKLCLLPLLRICAWSVAVLDVARKGIFWHVPSALSAITPFV